MCKELWMQHQCCTHTVSVYNMCIVSNFNDMYMATHCKLQKYLQIFYRLALPSCTTLRFLLPVKHQQLSFEGRIEARVYDMKGKRHQRFAFHVENNIQIIPQNQNATCTHICVKFYNFLQYRHQPKLTRYLYRFCWCYICGHLVSNLLESLSNLKWCFFFSHSACQLLSVLDPKKQCQAAKRNRWSTAHRSMVVFT